MKEKRVSIPSGGIWLEGLFNLAETRSLRRGVVLCHPHPLYGGDMYNTVIEAGVEAAFQEACSTLRFNFRGVGGSGGSYEEGVGEREDVKAAIDYLASEINDSKATIVFMGYSFGAWAGLPVAVNDPRINSLIAVAPPLDMYDFEFLKGCKKKKLLIAGSEDLYCPLPELRKLYSQLEEPKSLTIVEGADHFFFSHEPSLISPLREFLRTL